MAHHYGINRLMALVHPENYCVLHWMKKLEALEARESLEKAARGQSETSEEIREQLRKDVQSGNGKRL